MPTNPYNDKSNTGNAADMSAEYDLLFKKIKELSDKNTFKADDYNNDPQKVIDFLAEKNATTGETISDEIQKLTGFMQGSKEQINFVNSLITEIDDNLNELHTDVFKMSDSKTEAKNIKKFMDSFYSKFSASGGTGGSGGSGGGKSRDVELDLSNTSGDFQTAVENVFEVDSNGDLTTSLTENELASHVGPIAEAISKERKDLLSANEELKDELEKSNDPAERQVILDKMDKNESGLATIDESLKKLEEVDKSKLMADELKKLNKATNEKELSESLEVEKAKKEAMGAFAVISQGSATFAAAMRGAEDAVGGLAGAMGAAGGTIEHHAGIMSQNMQNLASTVLMTGGVLGMFMGAMRIATTSIKGFYDKLDIARDFNQGSGMVDAIRGMELKTLLPPEQLKAMSETLSSNFGVSMTRNSKEMEKMAIKQRMYERMMGKENAAQMLESLDGLRNSLSGNSADDMMANLAAQTTSLAKTMGVSNKFALEQIKRLKENTAVLTEGLDKDAAAAIQKTMEKEYAALAKVVGADAAEALTKAGAEALSSKENIAEDLGKQMTMLDLGGAGAERMEKVFKEAGLNKEQTFELYADAQLHGFENMSKEDQVTLTKLMTGSQVAQAEEIASVRQAMQEAADRGDKKEEQIQKERLALLSNRGLKGNSDVANAVKAGKMGKQYDNAKVEAGERQEGETAKIEINKLLAQATGGGSVEETNKLFNQLIAETKLSSEQQKQFTGNFNKFASDDLKAKMKEKGITEKDIEGKSPEQLMKLFESKGLKPEDYQGTIQDAFAGAAGPELAEKIKKMRESGEGSMKIGDKVVQGAQFKKDDESGALADKQVEAVSTPLEIAQDDATRLVIKANHAMEKSVMSIVNDTLSALKNALAWVTQNLNILAAAVMALGAAYLTSKLVDVTKKIGSGLTSFVNSMSPAEKKFKGFGDMLGSAMSGMNKVVKSSFSILPGMGKKTKLSGPAEPDIGFWEKMKKGYGSFKEGLKGGLKGLAGGLKSMVGPQAILAAGMLAFQGAMDGWGKATDIFISKADQDAGKTASIGQKFSAALGGAVNALSFGLVDTESAAKGIYSAFSDFGGFLEKTGVSQIFRDVKDGIVGAVTDLKNKVMAIIDFFGPTISAMKDSAIQIFGGFVQYIKGTFNIIKGIFTGDLTSISDGIKSISNGWVDIVTYPLTLIEGLMRTFFGDKIADAFGNAVDGAKDWFKEKLGKVIDAILTPFQPFIETAKNIVSNITTMFIEPFKGIFALITGDWAGFKESFFKMWSAFGNLIKNIPLLIWDGIMGIWDAIMGLGDIVQEAWWELEDWWASFSFYDTLIEPMINMLIEGFYALSDWWDGFSFYDTIIKPMTDMIGNAFSSMITAIQKKAVDWLGETVAKSLGIVDDDSLKKINDDKAKEKKEATISAVQEGKTGEALFDQLKDLDMTSDADGIGTGDNINSDILKNLSDVQLRSLASYEDTSKESKAEISKLLSARAKGDAKQETSIGGEEIKIDPKSLGAVKKEIGSDGKISIKDFSNFAGKSKEEIQTFYKENRDQLDEQTKLKLQEIRKNAKTERAIEIEKTTESRKSERETPRNRKTQEELMQKSMDKKHIEKVEEPNKSDSNSKISVSNIQPSTAGSAIGSLPKLEQESVMTNQLLMEIRNALVKPNIEKKTDGKQIESDVNVEVIKSQFSEGGSTGGIGDKFASMVGKLFVSPDEKVVGTVGPNEFVFSSEMIKSFISKMTSSKSETNTVSSNIGKLPSPSGDAGAKMQEVKAKDSQKAAIKEQRKIADEQVKKQTKEGIDDKQATTMVDTLKAMASKLNDATGGVAGKVAGGAAAVGGAYFGGATEIGKSITNSITSVLGGDISISDALTNIGDTAKGAVTNLGSTVKNLLPNALQDGIGKVGNMVSGVIGATGKVGSSISQNVSGVLSGDISAGDALKNVGQTIVGQLPGKITESLKSVTDKLSATGASITTNLQGVLTGETSIGDALKNVGGTMKEQLLGPLQTNLSSAFTQLTGEEGLGGVFKSFTSGEGGISSVFNSFTGEGGPLDSVFDAFDGDGSISDTFKTITSPEGPLGSALGGIGESITGALGSFDFGGMLGGIGDAVGGLFGGGSSSGGSGGGVMDSVMSAGKSLLGGFFASGGVTKPETINVIGESGPELVGSMEAMAVMNKQQWEQFGQAAGFTQGGGLEFKGPGDKASAGNIPSSAGTSGISTMGSGVKSSSVINNSTKTQTVASTTNTTNNNISGETAGASKDPIAQKLDVLINSVNKLVSHSGQQVKQGDRKFKADVNGQTVQNVKNMQGSKTLS